MSRTLAFVVPLLLASVLPTSAAPMLHLEVVGGVLHGAKDVEVFPDVFFNVEFRDGTCVSIFNGCDAISDFPFSTENDANAASQALLNQVLLDGSLGDFDLNPALTDGCTDPFLCVIATPYAFSSGSPPILLRVVFNQAITDQVVGGAILAIADTTFMPDFVYAVWTPAVVPEPASLSLLGLGLAGLGARRWRQRHNP